MGSSSSIVYMCAYMLCCMYTCVRVCVHACVYLFFRFHCYNHGRVYAQLQAGLTGTEESQIQLRMVCAMLLSFLPYFCGTGGHLLRVCRILFRLPNCPPALERLRASPAEPPIPPGSSPDTGFLSLSPCPWLWLRPHSSGCCPWSPCNSPSHTCPRSGPDVPSCCHEPSSSHCHPPPAPPSLRVTNSLSVGLCFASSHLPHSPHLSWCSWTDGFLGVMFLTPESPEFKWPIIPWVWLLPRPSGLTCKPGSPLHQLITLDFLLAQNAFLLPSPGCFPQLWAERSSQETQPPLGWSLNDPFLHSTHGCWTLWHLCLLLHPPAQLHEGRAWSCHAEDKAAPGTI